MENNLTDQSIVLASYNTAHSIKTESATGSFYFQICYFESNLDPKMSWRKILGTSTISEADAWEKARKAIANRLLDIFEK